MITAVYCGVTGYKSTVLQFNVTLISEIEVNYTLLTTTRQETTTQFYNEPTSTSQDGFEISKMAKSSSFPVILLSIVYTVWSLLCLIYKSLFMHY